ncbi:MAG: glycosyltransferase family 4 protein [Bacteroidales bacterium]|jgi:polysaccharide biosynthesis protein PslH|nr:glycosyltransferase family 4 protein [Bacteroidales bacterium]
MKILQLCHKSPYPPADGGTIAMNNITQGLLHEGFSVKVLAVETPKHHVSWENIPQDYLQKTNFEAVFIDTNITYSGAFKSLFSRKSYQVQRFYSKAFASKLKEILSQETFDVIHLESVFMTPYISEIRRYSQAKIVLRTHNIEHLIWERIIKNERNPLKKIALSYFAKQLKRYECSLHNQIDAFVAISEPDFLFFEKQYENIPGAVIPFGVDLENYENEEDYIPSRKPELFHVGSMDWHPNVEGIEWFLKEVWSKILAEYPEITFTIAGRNIPKHLQNNKLANVIIAGEVPDANEFMLSKDIMIVPLLSGSGVRVKIIEGMALGKVIITTSIGAEGLMVENGKNILIANTPEEFVAVLDKCVKTPDICTIIGENARNFVLLHHNNELITKQLIRFYESMLS